METGACMQTQDAYGQQEYCGRSGLYPLRCEPGAPVRQVSRVPLTRGPSPRRVSASVGPGTETRASFHRIGASGLFLDPAPHETASTTPPQTQVGRRASKQTIHPIRQHSRSLSYLSLTLWCMAPRSGWLGGCAPPHSRQSSRRAIFEERSCREGQARPQPSRPLIGRTCPAFV